MEKREIHALDYAISQVVSFLDGILFCPQFLDFVLKTKKDEISKERYKNLETLREFIHLEEREKSVRDILNGIDIEIVSQEAEKIVVNVLPVGWPKHSFLSFKIYRGISQRWSADKINLYIPPVFSGLRLINISDQFFSADVKHLTDLKDITEEQSFFLFLLKTFYDSRFIF